MSGLLNIELMLHSCTVEAPEPVESATVRSTSETFDMHC